MAALSPTDPTSLGGFDLTGRLDGTGAVSVFEATHGGQAYRIEAWETDADPEPELLAELVDDLQGLGDNVLSPVALGVDDGWVWCAFPTEGLSSLTRMLDDGPFVDDEWRELVRCLASAVEAIHNAGRVVGRLTTQDVLVTPAGVPVAMFGTSALAQMLGDPRGSAQLLEWMAPEMLQGGPASEATDMFAVGEIAAACATGRLPWGPAATPTATVMSRIAECAADLGGVPDAERHLIGRLLVPDPDARPAAASLRSTLEGDWPQDSGDDVSSVVTSAGMAPSAGANAAIGGQQRPVRKGLVLGGVGVAVLLVAAIGGVVAMNSGGADGSTAGSPTQEAGADISGDAGETPGAETSSSGSPDDGVNSDPSVAVGPIKHTTRINYSNDSIPDKIFADTLDWKFDVCLSDNSLTAKANSSKIALYRWVDGKWKKQGATATASKAGRCGNGKVNVTIDRAASIPEASRAGKGWSSCQKFRTVIPETPNFARTNIDFCVQTRTDEG